MEGKRIVDTQCQLFAKSELPRKDHGLALTQSTYHCITVSGLLVRVRLGGCCLLS
jgi:hypothetical protein